MAQRLIIALALLIGAASAGLAQSQAGSSFGTPFSGSAASRSGGGHVYARHRDSGGGGSGGQSPQSGGGERDARDSGGSGPVARQASTPSR